MMTGKHLFAGFSSLIFSPKVLASAYKGISELKGKSPVSALNLLHTVQT